ncbi:MAG: non-heme iron oxygenase ferredoxin subunit [Chloroflexi bacterium]|nr:non-heme iron oxygenase ferredoxin subunit [Chloroflexota bacterium]
MSNDRTMKRRYELFVRCYRGRADAVAQQQVDGSFRTLPGGFTYERFLEQVNQTHIYGAYNLDAGGNVGFLMYDMDVFPRLKQSWEQLVPELRAKRDQVQALISALGHLGVQPDQVLVEFPTVGFHVVLPLAEPIPVREAKAFGRLARDRAGLRHETPFYPHEVSGYGDMVRLPLRLNDLTGQRSNFVRDIATFDPATYDQTPDFAPLEKLRPIEAKVMRSALAEAERGMYRRVARADEVAPGSTRLVHYRGQRVLLVNDAGSFYALAETCPHAEAPLSIGPLRDGVLTCPWHGARFRVATGEALAGPAHEPLVHHAVRVRGEDILVGPARP